MKSRLQALAVAATVALLAVTTARAENFSEGIEYVRLASPQPTAHADKIEIVELFWYGCPHCFHFEPLLHEWTAALPEDVEFIRMPAILSPRWELLARAYYAAELMGVLDKIHMPLFQAIHEKKQRFENEESLATFVAAQGVDAEAFRKAMKSFGVASKINRARQMTQRYGINGVPSLVINGKYRTSASEAGSHEMMIKVADFLIAQQREANSAAPAAPAPAN